MYINKHLVGLFLILLILGSELGAKCEAERIPFVAEVGRYFPYYLDSWTLSSTRSTLKKKFS